MEKDFFRLCVVTFDETAADPASSLAFFGGCQCLPKRVNVKRFKGSRCTRTWGRRHFFPSRQGAQKHIDALRRVRKQRLQ